MPEREVPKQGFSDVSSRSEGQVAAEVELEVVVDSVLLVVLSSRRKGLNELSTDGFYDAVDLRLEIVSPRLLKLPAR